MLPLVLETLVEKLQTVGKAAALRWVPDEPTQDDLNHILEQSKEDSSFDVLKLRSTMLKDVQEGRAHLVCRRLVGGDAGGAPAKILALVYPGTKIPWKLFAKIFLAFGRPKKASWRVVWFAHPTPRQFPVTIGYNGLAKSLDPHPKVGPEHVNGGYAYPCEPGTIVIYREEEAARVLVHELLHASCTDNMNHTESQREVLTESWAELFLTAIQAGGSKMRAAKLWRIQAQWIADQEAILTRDYGVTTPEHYAWRYTVGRRQTLASLGVGLPPPSPDPAATIGGSLRFTTPLLTQPS